MMVLHSMFLFLLKNISILKLLTLLMGNLQESFSFVGEIEKLLLDSANAKSTSLPEKLESIYHEDLNMDKLKIQLKMLPDAVKVTPMNGIPIKQVTRIQTICQVFNIQPTFKKLLAEVHKLLRIYLTIPVTTSTAERNFSALRRIKSYLRSSMTQARLNHCLLLHVLRDKTDQLDKKDVAKEFIERNERRRNYFGQL